MPFRLLYGMASPAQHTGPGMMRGWRRPTA